MPDYRIAHGRVKLGVGAIVGDNVILGHRKDGEVIIGDGALIRSGTVIYSDVKIGKNFRTGHNVLIRENTDIGDDVLIGSGSVIDGNCKIGHGVSIQTGVYITAYTVIEDGVFMGPCCVTTNDKYMERGTTLKGPTIKRGARIGANVVILPGVTIGEGAVIGAGAVVVRDVAPKTTVVGNPTRELTEK